MKLRYVKIKFIIVCFHPGAGRGRQVGICRHGVRGAAGRGAPDNAPTDGGRGTPSVCPAGLAHRPYMCRGCLRRWIRRHRDIRTQEEGVSNHGRLCLTYMFTVHAVFYSNQFFFYIQQWLSPVIILRTCSQFMQSSIPINFFF